jgi:hypothetical protein
MLTSRDPGAIQVAGKGNYRRSIPNEELIGSLLNNRGSCQEVRAALRGRTRPDRRAALADWLATRDMAVDWAMFYSSLDFVYRNNLYPWTGAYADAESGTSVVIVGNRTVREKSAVYLDGTRIERFQFSNGLLSWSAQGSCDLYGTMRLDLRLSSERRVVLKTWARGQDPGRGEAVALSEADPARQAVAAASAAGGFGIDPRTLHGSYALRRGGRFARTVFDLTVGPDSVRVDGCPVDGSVQGTRLTWTAGTGPCAEGTVTFVPEPILGSVELYGTTRSADDTGPVTCYGARLADDATPAGPVPLLPPKAQESLEAIVQGARHTGGLLLWHKWEKASFTNITVSKHLAGLV